MTKAIAFRCRKWHCGLNEKIHFERRPSDESSASSFEPVLSKEQCLRLLENYLRQYPSISRPQYSRLTGRRRRQAIDELNEFIAEGVLMTHEMGKTVVYAKAR